MRDMLALALVRAELCRAYAVERPRLNRTGWKIRARAGIGRVLRSIRTMSRGLTAVDAKSRHARRAASDTSSPPD